MLYVDLIRSSDFYMPPDLKFKNSAFSQQGFNLFSK